MVRFPIESGEVGFCPLSQAYSKTGRPTCALMTMILSHSLRVTGMELRDNHLPVLIPGHHGVFNWQLVGVPALMGCVKRPSIPRHPYALRGASWSERHLFD